MTDERVLTLWVVFAYPNDYPHGYVVRPQHVHRDGRVEVDTDARYSPTLDGARQLIPLGLTPLGREPDDDPTICEVWI